MKRILSIILALAMALSLTAVFAEEPAEAPAEEAAADVLPFDPQAVLDEATADMLGASYEIIGLIANVAVGDELMVAGFLCRVTVVAPDSPSSLAVLLIAYTPEGEAQVIGAMNLPYEDEDEVTADYLADNLYAVVADLPVGTAGAALEQAKAVMTVMFVASVYRFDQVDDLAALLDEAFNYLSEEQQTAFAENAPAIFAEAMRLSDPAEALDPLFEDAGVDAVVEALRAEETFAPSMAALCAAVNAE